MGTMNPSKNTILSEMASGHADGNEKSDNKPLEQTKEAKVEFIDFIPETKDGSPRIKGDNVVLR